MVLLSLFALSCGKREIGTDVDGKVKLDPVAVAIKLIGPWKITGFIKRSGVDYFNTTMPLCEKDNIITYLNGYVSIDEKSLKCNLTDAQIVTHKSTIGEYMLRTYAGNGGDLVEDFEILLLNETTLKLKNISNNNSINDIITYTRQADIRIVNPLTGKWKKTGEVFRGINRFLLKDGECKSVDYNGFIDKVCAPPECEKDDFVIFTEYFTGIGDEGPTKCSVTDVQVGNFTFKINGGNFALNDVVRTLTTIDSSVSEYEVISLTSTTMKLHMAGTAASDYEEFTRTP